MKGAGRHSVFAALCCLHVLQVLALPHLVERPGRLHRRWHCRAGAHQHGTVDVGCHHQDAEEDGPYDCPLQTQIVSSTCHCQTCQIWMSTPDAQRHRKEISEVDSTF